jgi:hypothetical protein
MNELQTQDAPTANVGAMMFNPGAMNSLLAFADMMAKSSVTVPDHLKGKPADCMAIAMQAMQWGMNPFAVAQKTHIVSGRLGYEAQLVNAVVQQSNAIRGAFSYEFQGTGDALECRVGAVLRGDSDVTWGEWLRCGSVTTKNSPLWKVNPKQQLGYLQVKNWARLYAPGAILGVYTPDELESVAPPPANKNMGPADVVTPPDAPAPPTWPDEAFALQLPRWTKAVLSGIKSPDDIVTLARSKGSLTADQEAAIRAIKADEPEPVDPFLAEMEAAEGAQA